MMCQIPDHVGYIGYKWILKYQIRSYFQISNILAEIVGPNQNVRSDISQIWLHYFEFERLMLGPKIRIFGRSLMLFKTANDSNSRD